jgi:hypothetical protein
MAFDSNTKAYGVSERIPFVRVCENSMPWAFTIIEKIGRLDSLAACFLHQGVLP